MGVTNGESVTDSKPAGAEDHICSASLTELTPASDPKACAATSASGVPNDAVLCGCAAVRPGEKFWSSIGRLNICEVSAWNRSKMLRFGIELPPNMGVCGPSSVPCVDAGVAELAGEPPWLSQAMLMSAGMPPRSALPDANCLDPYGSPLCVAAGEAMVDVAEGERDEPGGGKLGVDPMLRRPAMGR